MEKLLIIDNYDSFTYNLAQIVEEYGNIDCDIVKNDCINFDSMEQYSKILISPGPGIPDEAGDMKKVIEIYGATKSILGICLGHQAIVEVYGGHISNLKNVFHGIRCKTRILDAKHYIFKDLDSVINVGLYHSWAVELPLPLYLVLTAVSEKGVIMGVRHLKHDVVGLQFHPESYMTDIGATLLKNWLNHNHSTELSDNFL
jgi:anthranilate synthase component II